MRILFFLQFKTQRFLGFILAFLDVFILHIYVVNALPEWYRCGDGNIRSVVQLSFGASILCNFNLPFFL